MVKVSVITSLYNCKNYLLGYLSNALMIRNFLETEFILIHNSPSREEIEIINSFKDKFKNNLIHLIIPEKEKLYESWNRAIDISKGKFLAIWNVDDIRLEDSLERQIKVLESDEKICFTYGDQIEVIEYGKKTGKYIYQPDFLNNKNSFLRNYYCGCFPMWKKDVHKKIGFFDEQFYSAGDFDFFIRLARFCNGKKTEGNLGYYLASSGISKTGRINNIERTVIELRYSQFDKVNFLFLYWALRNYKIFKLKFNNKFHNVSEFFNNYHIFYLLRINLIFIGLLLFPFKFLIPTIFRYINYFIKSKSSN